MAINDKLNRIKEIKEDIKQALIDKGVEVTDEDSFGSYADKITNIPMEGGDPYYEDLYNVRTSNGTNMSGLFAYMNTIGDNLDLTGLDVSQCTNMSYMFNQCTARDIIMTGWDTTNVKRTTYMFSGCSANIDLSELNTINVTDMSYMFNNFTGSADFSKLKTDNVTNMSNTFSGYNKTTLDLSSARTSNVTNMSSVFSFAYGSKVENLIIPNWDMTNTTSHSSFFGYSEAYTKNLKYIDLSNSNDVTISKIASYLPKRTETTYGDVVIPETTSQETIDAITAKYWRPVGPSIDIESFQIASELDEILLGRKTKLVVHSISPWYANPNNIEFIVSDDSIVTIDENNEIRALSLGSVEIYARLKDNPDIVSNTITINISETDSTPYVIKFKGTPTPTSSNGMMINNKSVKLSSMEYNDATGVYTYDVGEEITSIRFMKSELPTYADTITELLKFDFNGNNITSMSHMFAYCSLLKKIDVDISNWDTSNVTDMYYMFSSCEVLEESLDLSNWNTENVKSMGYSFYRCKSLKTLDISSWNNKQSINHSLMLYEVPSTCQIYVGPNWTATESDCNFTGTFIRVNPEYYTEYSINSSTATFNMRSVDSINSGAYLPELSNGYDAVLLTLNDGSITTDLNTEANQVSSIKIYYPEETSYVKFANTKVKEVNHLSGSNITDCTGMFTNCVYLEKADLTSLDSTKVSVDTTMFEGVSPEAEVTFNDSWDIPESDMGRGEQVKYITGFDVDYADGTEITKEGNYFNIYPWEQGCDVAFSVEFVDYTYSEPDTLYAWISDEEYENYKNGSSNMIRCHAYQQIHGQSGSATLVIYETNSQYEVRIPVTIKEDSSTGGGDEPDVPQEGKVNVTVHYHNPNGEYGCGEWISFNRVDDPSAGTGSDFGYEDDFGRYTIMQLDKDTAYNVSASYQGTNFATGEFTFTEDTELWVIYGDGTIYTEKPETEEPGTGGNDTLDWPEPTDPNNSILALHYNRTENDYDGWDVWAWDTGASDGSIEFTSEDNFGKIAFIEAKNGNTIGYNIRRNDWSDKNYPDDQRITITENTEIWVTQGQNGYYTDPDLETEVVPEAKTYSLTLHYYHPGDENNFDGSQYSCSRIEIYDEDTYERIFDDSLDNHEEDDFGRVINVEYVQDKLYHIIVSYEDNIFIDEPLSLYNEDTELWIIYGDSTIYTERPEI